MNAGSWCAGPIQAFIWSVSSNDLARSFRRIVDDLSSYYLLGYYSNGKLDGRFHTISVRVKRPGVQVRARRTTRRAFMRAIFSRLRSATGMTHAFLGL